MTSGSPERGPIVADNADGDMLDVLVRKTHDLDSSDDFFPLRAAAAAEELEIVLADPAALQLAADRVRDTGERLHADSVLGASNVGNRLAAFSAGLGLTALLQSSTATGLMAASFTAEGLLGLVPALAFMLGAPVRP